MHPTRPYILSASDDMLIKLWDWEEVRTCNSPEQMPMFSFSTATETLRVFAGTLSTLTS